MRGEEKVVVTAADGQLVAWIIANTPSLRISPKIIAEMQEGAAKWRIANTPTRD